VAEALAAPALVGQPAAAVVVGEAVADVDDKF